MLPLVLRMKLADVVPESARTREWPDCHGTHHGKGKRVDSRASDVLGLVVTGGALGPLVASGKSAERSPNRSRAILTLPPLAQGTRDPIVLYGSSSRADSPNHSSPAGDCNPEFTRRLYSQRPIE
jgi:hypothetical protein